IEFKDQHGATRTVPGFRDKRATEELARNLETDAQRIAAGLLPQYPDVTAEHLTGAPSTGMSWADFRKRFEAEHAAGLRDRSGEKYRTVFTVLEEECNPKALRAIDEALLSRF